jgi:hypothetical protein
MGHMGIKFNWPQDLIHFYVPVIHFYVSWLHSSAPWTRFTLIEVYAAANRSQTSYILAITIGSNGERTPAFISILFLYIYSHLNINCRNWLQDSISRSTSFREIKNNVAENWQLEISSVSPKEGGALARQPLSFISTKIMYTLWQEGPGWHCLPHPRA